jgi:hypothetical protein
MKNLEKINVEKIGLCYQYEEWCEANDFIQ